MLREGQRAYWNDLDTHSFGMFELAPGLYRRGAQICKIAQETVIHASTGLSSTQAFLYCGGAGAAWQIECGVVCRPVTGGAAATCRTARGSIYETLPPA
jgi:hypothetical protein